MTSRILLVAVCCLLGGAACAPFGGRGGQDYWGHRPGPKGFRTVILDAGHGGKDPGAISRTTGQMEKDLNLDLVKRLRAELRGFKIVLLRDDDTFIDLDDRVNMTKRYGDAILVSVHFNAGAAQRRGPETYYWRVDSHGLAVRCQRAMNAVCGNGGGSDGLVRRRLRLTRNTEIPSVLLEGGYLSNPSEARLIASPDHRQCLAHAIAAAISAQAADGDAGTGPRPAPINAPPSRPDDAAGS